MEIPFPCAVLLSVFIILNPIDGRTIVKRSPQLSLTVIDEPDTTPRQHPPSIEDLEERRKALVKAIVPGGNSEGGGSVGGGQLQSLADLGLDLVGGSIMNAGELFAPLRNATKKARENFPRVGDVLNRVVDSKRAYRKKISGVLRISASTTVNNAIRALTTAGARGTEVVGGILKLMRTIFDNFTLAIQNLSQVLSRGLARFSQMKTRFLTTGFGRIRTVLSNGRLLAPVKAATEFGGNLARGLASDFSQAQPWINDAIKSKLTLGAALVPRPNIASILSPLGNPEPKQPCSNSDEFDTLDLTDTLEGSIDGGYAKKREMDSEKKESSDEGEMDILELLGSSNLESKSEGNNGTTSTTTTESTDTNEVSVSSKLETNPTTTTTPPTTTTSKTEESTVSKEATTAGSIEDLFGITSKST